MASKVILSMIAVVIISLSGPSPTEGCDLVLKLIHGVLHAALEAKEKKKSNHVDAIYEKESPQPAPAPLPSPPNRVVYMPQGYQYQPFGWQGYWRSGYTTNYARPVGVAAEQTQDLESRRH